MIGGVCINTGTIPSKTLREAVVYLTGLNMRDLYGQNYRVKDDITIQDLLSRTQHVIGREIEIVRSQLMRNHVDLLHGHRSLRRPAHRRRRPRRTASGDRTVTAEKFVIATGTRPARPAEVEFDGQRIVDSDGILNLEDVPALDGRRRCRGHRHRVRVDVRRARHPGDRRRARATRCSSSATPRSSRR